jgi:choline dehydrogenase-like flavoprotein
MGTTRMSWDPGQGVVNPDCRVHSVPNLYVASSSVFPTGGYANPTFTVLALSLRLADHIKGLLATQPVQGSRSLISEATNS